MARSLARVLKTEMSTDLPLKAMAQALRKKGRGRDTVLAHITPREAAKLKREGGSGTINPDTGLPEFDDGFDFGSFMVDTGGSNIGALPDTASIGPVDAGTYVSPPVYTPSFPYGTLSTGSDQGAIAANPYMASMVGQQFYDPSAAPGGADYPGYYGYTPPVSASDLAGLNNMQALARGDTAGAIAGMGGGAGGSEFSAGGQTIDQIAGPGGLGPAGPQNLAAQTPPADQQGFFGKALGQLTSDPLRALIAGGGLGLTGLNYLRAQNQAKQQAQAYQQAYQQAASQSQALAQPFIQQGGTQLAQALQGQLSAAQQQQLQAAQAATQQGIAGRGGVGAQQAERSLEDLRQRLLADQQTLALKLYGEGTPLLQSAIQAQLQGTIGSQNIQAQASQAAGQAASALLQSLAALYGYSGKSK
jgi:hypothetical protein